MLAYEILQATNLRYVDVSHIDKILFLIPIRNDNIPMVFKVVKLESNSFIKVARIRKADLFGVGEEERRPPFLNFVL